MSISSDPGHFFQTEASLASSARKSAKKELHNTSGAPVQLPSKILAVLADPTASSAVYVAEAAGTARRIDLASPETKNQITLRGSTTPLTSLALSPSGAHLFAGAWDKSVWSWTLSARHPFKRYSGVHTDFVKCVATAQITGLGPFDGDEILISGAADASIVVWAVRSGAKLHVLKGEHPRGVLSLLVDPFLSVFDQESRKVVSIKLWSAGSTGEILRWEVSAKNASLAVAEDEAGEGDIPVKLAVHETSVNKLTLDEEGDIWSASSDKTAKGLSRMQGLAAETTLSHPDFVRDVAVDTELGVVVTACRDEEVRVWDAGTGDLLALYSGHWEEVTGVCIISLNGKRMACSVGIDGTLRTWSLERKDLQRVREEAARKKEAEEKGQEEIPESTNDGAKPAAQEPGKQKIELTEDEERELAELMEDDD